MGSGSGLGHPSAEPAAPGPGSHRVRAAGAAAGGRALSRGTAWHCVRSLAAHTHTRPPRGGSERAAALCADTVPVASFPHPPMPPMLPLSHRGWRVGSCRDWLAATRTGRRVHRQGPARGRRRHPASPRPARLSLSGLERRARPAPRGMPEGDPGPGWVGPIPRRSLDCAGFAAASGPPSA